MEDETTILNHYNLNTLDPRSWPTEKDESDDSDEDVLPQKKAALRRSKTRYSALERKGSDRRSLVPGSQRTTTGVENLVQKDEADPLGGTDSVIRVLREKGIPVEEDSRLRERPRPQIIRLQLTDPREQISLVVNHLLTLTIPLPSPCECIFTILITRPRLSIPFN